MELCYLVLLNNLPQELKKKEEEKKRQEEQQKLEEERKKKEEEERLQSEQLQQMNDMLRMETNADSEPMDTSSPKANNVILCAVEY